MRIRPDFIMREIAGECILIPTGEAARNLSGLIALNPTGKFLFDLLQEDVTEEYLLSEMLSVYAVEKSVAENDIKHFLELLRVNDMLD